MELVDKLIEFSKKTGLTDEDIEALKVEDSDVSVFTSKIFNNYKETLKSDEEIKQHFTKDVTGQLIGKDNQLKKMLRKEFGLSDITEKELKELNVEDFIKKAKEKIPTKDANEELNAKIIELSELLEKKDSDYESLLNEEKQKALNYISSFKKNDKLKTNILKYSETKADNVDMALGAFNGMLSVKGWLVDINDRDELILKNVKDNSPVIIDNKRVNVNDIIPIFFKDLAPAKNERGSMDNFRLNDKQVTRKINSSDLELLQLMGTGIN